MTIPMPVVLQNVLVNGTLTTIAPATLATCVVGVDINVAGKETVDTHLRTLYSVTGSTSKTLSTLNQDYNTFKTATNQVLTNLRTDLSDVSSRVSSLSLTVGQNHTTVTSSISGLNQTVSGLSSNQTTTQNNVYTLQKKLEKIASFKYGDYAPTYTGSEGEVYFEY